MRFVQLDEKNEERMNAIRKFTLMDDTFMTQVFSGDKESTQELLRMKRYAGKTPQNKNIRL